MEMSAIKVEPKLMDKVIETFKVSLNVGKHYHQTDWPPELLAWISDLAAREKSLSKGQGPMVFTGRTVSWIIAPDLRPELVRFHLDIAVVNDQSSPAALTWLEARLRSHSIPLKQFVDVRVTDRIPASRRLPISLQPRSTESFSAEFEAIAPGMGFGGGFMELQVVGSINERPHSSRPFTVFGNRSMADAADAQRLKLTGPIAIDLPLLPLPVSEFAKSLR